MNALCREAFERDSVGGGCNDSVVRERLAVSKSLIVLNMESIFLSLSGGKDFSVLSLWKRKPSYWLGAGMHVRAGVHCRCGGELEMEISARDGLARFRERRQRGEVRVAPSIEVGADAAGDECS